MISPERIAADYGGDVSGSTVTFPTPGHGPKDRGMSVTVDPGAPGGFLVNSFNDGDALAMKRDLMERYGIEREQRRPAWRETGQYEYRAVDGTVLYRTVRLEKDGEPKRFAAQRASGRGGWINGLRDVERVPYNLPALAITGAATPVYFVEGERKADKLVKMGFVATAIAFGAKGWRHEYAAHFAGRTVIILPDNDEVGRAFAAKVKAGIEAEGATAAIVELRGLPPKGDVIDWAGTADELKALSEATLSPPPKLLPLIDIAGWEGRDPPPRQSAWGDWIPLHQTTMLTGDGGVGKSLLAQMLCTCVALGLPFLGKETRVAPALYLTAEDDADELWRRQRAICASLGIRLVDVDGRLSLASLIGVTDTALAIFDSNGRCIQTDRWREVNATAEAIQIGFAAFDNATDMMAGDHSNIHQVAGFVQMLTGLAIRRGGASLIIHHTNKAGDDWLGSVSWQNKVRSRFIMKKSDNDPDIRVLENPKANYSQSGGRLECRWFRGAFVRDEDLPPNMAAELSKTALAVADNTVFLACLAERIKQRRAVSEKHSPTFAPTAFAKMPESKSIGKARLERAMDRLFRSDSIERGELWKGPDRKPVFGLRETAGDGAVNAAGDVRETQDPTEADDGAGDAGETYTPTKGERPPPLGEAAPQKDGRPGC